MLRRQADEFIGIQETKILLNQVERSFPELVKEVLRTLPLQTVSEILKRLVSEEVSLRNMRSILTALVEWGHKEKDTVLLTEHVRCALRRQICFRHSFGSRLIPAYILAPEMEDTVRNAIRQTSAGSYLALDPDTTRQIIDKMREAVGNVGQQPHQPVLLTSIDVRRYLRKIIEGDFYGLPVLSYQELTPDISVLPLARISLS